MESISLTREEFEIFRKVQNWPHARWPAVFSCNANEDVSLFHGYGFTYEANRSYLNGKICFLDKIVKYVLEVRPEGGRFFIDDNGVYLGEPEGSGKPVLEFKFSTE